jgi:hypothetical protein
VEDGVAAARGLTPEFDAGLAPLDLGVAIRLGLQIPNFSYGTSLAELFPAVKAQAEEAEAAGFDTVLVMDHIYPLPGLGEPDEPMLEAYTAHWALWPRPPSGCSCPPW